MPSLAVFYAFGTVRETHADAPEKAGMEPAVCIAFARRTDHSHMKRSRAFLFARPSLLRPYGSDCVRHGRAIARAVPGLLATMRVVRAQAAVPLEHSALAPAGIQAEHIVRLWYLTLVVCGVVFAAVLVGVLFALLRRRTNDDAPPPDMTANVKPERKTERAVVGVSVLSVVLLVGLIVADVLTDRALSKLPVSDALHIQLTGWQWWWQARYAADDGRPAFMTANELHVPVGRPVVISLGAGDVIHSFWVPSLHGKKDLLPGIHSTIQFRADRAGVYDGPCAEFCGAEHALMALRVVAEPADRYAAWAATQTATAAAPVVAVAAHGMQVFESSACASCHTVRGTSAAGLVGPDLTHLMTRQTLAAGALANNAANLSRWIRDPNGVKPGTTMPAVRLSTPDLQALVAWLTTLK
jgi:cytochrome c oxidase subunit II